MPLEPKSTGDAFGSAWAVAPTTAGAVGLRIMERRHVTGMLDLTAEGARELAGELIRCADQLEPPAQSQISEGPDGTKA